jgi:hypothetical protein
LLISWNNNSVNDHRASDSDAVFDNTNMNPI